MNQATDNKLELLAPAGDSEAMHAAVANGADAVYFGLADFNARHRADNIASESMPATLEYLHSHNVRGYVAFNTLVFSDELEKAATCIVDIAAAAADAVIIQDLGILHLMREMAPSMECHGSTQMTLTDARGIEVVTAMGIGRVILARELSIGEIGKITKSTPTPVEVFCHGAICVSYSGQCLTSESIGGRSANRGQCAQACRLPYVLIVDGRPVAQDGRQFLLSPQDLAAFDKVAQLAAIGVSALKIEGRLKSAQYVAATTAAYREAVDSASTRKKLNLSRERQAQLTQSFSRGFTHGFLDGANHQELVRGVFSKKRGVQVGQVVGNDNQSVRVRLEEGETIKPGDGMLFDEGHPEQDEQGGRVYEVAVGPGGILSLRFGKGAVVTSAIATGSLVWKTDDPAINRQLEQSYGRDVVAHREGLLCIVRAVAGEPLTISLQDRSGMEVKVESAAPVELARKFPLDEALLREQIGRLGDTPYELGDVVLHGRTPADAAEAVMVPKSVLNELRRLAVEQLLEKRKHSRSHPIVRPQALQELRESIAVKYPPAPGIVAAGARLTVLVRTLEQLEAAITWGKANVDKLAMIWCDFEDARRSTEVVNLARAAGVPVGLATMRIAKPGEDGILRLTTNARPDAILIRNLSALAYMAENCPKAKLVGDYSLNVTNEISAHVLLSGQGWGHDQASSLLRLTPSHDLNAQQLEAMLRRIDGGLFEIVLHQHMPMFHMEHCVFAHMLSEGRSSRDCGRPCETHHVSLRDRCGIDHPLQADSGCRNTVFNGRAQSAAGYVPRLRELGVRHFRVELLQENAKAVDALLSEYAAIIGGELPAGPTTTGRRVLNLMGVTPGTLAFE